MAEKPKDIHFDFSSNDWQQLFDTAPCGYILTNDGGQVIKANQTILRWLGYERNEVEQALKFSDLISVGGKLFYETTHRPLLKLQDTVNEINYKMIGKDGIRLPMLVNSTQYMEADKETVRYILFVVFLFQDRIKYEKELLEAKKKAEVAANAKSVFLSSITHEIRTPLHSIINAGEILQKENPRPDQLDLIMALQFSTKNLLELINSVLDLSKMEAGKNTLTNQVFDLHQLAKTLTVSFRPQAVTKGIDIVLSIADNVAQAYSGDQGKLRQVLTNLLGNAIKFTENGQVKLTITSENEGLVKFEVSDTGIGIDATALNKIFAPFTQADDHIHLKFGGSGLGLAISQKILELFNCELKVASEIGKGSVFSFSLPLEIADASKLPKSAQKEINWVPIQGITALVVDDVKANILILDHYFKKWELDYEFVTNGFDAITAIQQRAFDIVFMDISMPGIDGYETTARIRALPGKQYQQLPIIALSAFDTNIISTKLKDKGIDGILQKPFQPEQLYELIKKVAKEKQLPAFSTSEKEKTEAPAMVSDTVDKRLDFEEVHSFFENDLTDIKNYFSACVITLSEVQQTLKQAMADGDRTAYKHAVHKLSTMIFLLKLHDLADLLATGKNQLQSNHQEGIVRTSLAIQNHFDWIVTQIETKIQEL